MGQGLKPFPEYMNGKVIHIQKPGRYNFLALLLIIQFASTANGQETDIKFETYSTQHGMTQGSVVTVFQDDEGFMWFGTYRGLNRFDGYTFHRYYHTDDDPYSISDDHVRAMCQDSAGILFVATVNGLNRFFTGEEKFISYNHKPDDPNSLSHDVVYDIVRDNEGNFWIATWGGGINKMEVVKGNYNEPDNMQYKFTQYLHNPESNSISSNQIPDLTIGPEGNLWIASTNGLNKLDLKTMEFTVIRHDPKNKNSLSNNNVSSVCFDPGGNIWVGTWEGGLNHIDLKTNRITRFRNEPSNPYSLSHNIVMRLFCDQSGDIWVGTWGGGLNRILYSESSNVWDINAVRFLRYQHSKLNLSSIGSNSIYSVFQDRTGIVWVGTDWGGVSKFEKELVKFRHIFAEQSTENGLINNIVFSFLFDNEDMLWIGTHEGLNRYDPKTGRYEVFLNDPADPNSLSDNQVKSIIQAKDGSIWLGTAQGLNKFNPGTNNFERYYIDPKEPGSTCLMKLYEASDGNIWLGTFNYGLYKFDPVTGNFTDVIPETEEGKAPENDVVWSITEDRNRNIWIGMIRGGLYRYNLASGKFTSFKPDPEDTSSISNHAIVSLYIDRRNRLWVGTGFGLNMLDLNELNNPVFISYFAEDGLSSNEIYGIIEDDYNQLWIAAAKGLTRFNQAENTFQAFNARDGLQDDEFSINALLKDAKTGEIYAGGVNGFNIFDPALKITDDVPPVVALVGLKIFNRPVAIGDTVNDNVILRKTINATEKLELTVRENVFSVDYAALHFKSPQSNLYAFMLEGFDNDWNYVDDQRSATYTNLKAGKYRFMVKAANPDGIWNDAPTILDIVIKPPWWNTLLFKLIAIASLIIIVISIYRLRISILKKNQQQLERMVTKRTEELHDTNVLLEEKQKEITHQNKKLLKSSNKLQILNKELQEHRHNLENLIEQRTAELTAAKIRAEESDKLKSTFLANMSHEVRTPMNAIIGFSSLLDDEDFDTEEKNEFIRLIKNNGNALLTLINDILDISMIEANQLVLFRENFCVNDLLRELYTYFRFHIRNDISLEYINAENDEKIFIYNDPVRFRQVMNNLISNAYKYTDKGTVKFGYTQYGANSIEVFVEDTGIGIRKKDLNSIFDYFNKADTGETKIYEGTGIGLTICDRLVSLMGSSIRVDSEVDVGSRFYFALPVVKDLVPEDVTDSPNKEVIQIEGINILVAEDEQDNYILIKNILSKAKAKIYRARDGKEAVTKSKELIRSGTKHIILMDIKMPVVSGTKATEEIKKIDSTIPIIALTAYAQPGDMKKIMRYNFDDYLSKPVDSNLLLNTIKHYVRKMNG